MPRGKNGKKAVEQPEVAWGGFIELRLSEADKQHFEEWSPQYSVGMIDDILGDDIKLSLSFDAETSTYLCSLTSEKHAGPALRCVLPARAGVWERAVMLALFKHFEILGEDWTRYRPSSGRAAEV